MEVEELEGKGGEEDVRGRGGGEGRRRRWKRKRWRGKEGKEGESIYRKVTLLYRVTLE